MLRIKKYSLFIHLFGWVIFISLPLLFLSGLGSDVFEQLRRPPFWIFVLSFLGLFYFNTYILVPKLYQAQKIGYYFLTVFFLLLLFNGLKPLGHLMRAGIRPEFGPPGFPPPFKPFKPYKHHHPPKPPPFLRVPPPVRPAFDITSIFLFTLVIILGIAIQTREKLLKTEKKVAFAEKEKAHAELSFLKAQINPHFLFNTLNNIYGLAVAGSKHTAESILQLSNIMRYVTDEAGRDFVPLQAEVDRIGDFIDLQKLRLGKTTLVTYLVTGDPSMHQVPPLLLLTFVENIFKYGISKSEKTEVVIKVQSEENFFAFETKNSIFSTKEKFERTGIGVENAKKRLDYLYSGKYQLEINSHDKEFTVYLKVYR